MLANEVLKKNNWETCHLCYLLSTSTLKKQICGRKKRASPNEAPGHEFKSPG